MELLDRGHAEVERLLSQRGAGASDAEIAEAFGALGRLYFAYQFVAPAEAALSNAAALAPDDLRWQYYLGLLQLEGRNFDESARHFERVLADDPVNQAARLRLAEARIEAGESEEAGRLYERVLESDPDNAAAHYGLGRIAQDEGRQEDAIGHYEAALAAQPSATRIHYLLARAYRRTGDSQKAAEHAALYGEGEVVFQEPLLRDLSLSAETAEFHTSTADRAAAAGRMDFAAAEYRAALEIDPEDFKALMGLGAVLEQQGDLESAEPSYRKALELAPETVFLHAALGRLLIARGDLAGGIEQLERAVRLDPQDPQVALQLALLRMQTGDYPRALELFDGVLELSPQNRMVLLERPRALRRLGRNSEALAASESARTLMPEDPAAALSLGIDLMTPDADRAIALFDAVVDDPSAEGGTKALAYYNRGVLATQRGDDASAASDFERALRIDPDLAAAHFHLGNAIARSGDYGAAARRYAALLDLEPDHLPGRLAHATALNLDGECAAAAETLQQGLLAIPADLVLSHTLARVLASCPSGDPQRALELAQMVFRRSPTFEHGETISLCWFALGAYEQASNWQKQLIREARQVGDDAWAARLEAGLENLADPGTSE